MTPLLERDIYLFDLDNTLYQPKEQLIEQIIVRMRDSVAKQMQVSKQHAYDLCEEYYRLYGGTLRGIQLHHPELDLNSISFEAHHVDLQNVQQQPALQQALRDNSKTRYVFTNSPRPYAERVLQHLGLSNYFNGIFSVEQTDYQMKPDPFAFERICNHFSFQPQQAVMFDDQPSNLATAKEMGMRTVLVNRNDLDEHSACYRTEQLPNFIDALNSTATPSSKKT
ncbi:pyrimidine 5'-nucleotidase [Ferrimonas lipolytica]|uniref:Pyrimidine 5'-nucleotidase n=1 Tax=Ferrimonas lipolytica TaxID=2724191 RepID=A0A6H1UC85_9GAMM|nr:pyrimidine 5'-nucleotidase [Ferrimonas lipolytica]QIZ76707.1 pyrimidine 5'-nucleotidase [Ferrimonas lipolytica]